MNFSLRPGFVCILTAVDAAQPVQLSMVQEANLTELLRGLQHGVRVDCSAFFMDAPAAWAELSQTLGLSQPHASRVIDLRRARQALNELGRQETTRKQELQRLCASMASVGEFSLEAESCRERGLPSQPVTKGSALEKLLAHVVSPHDGRSVRALLRAVWDNEMEDCSQELALLRGAGVLVCPQEGLALLDKRPGHSLEQVFCAELNMPQWAKSLAPVAGFTPDFRVVPLQAWLDATLAGPELVDCVSPL